MAPTNQGDEEAVALECRDMFVIINKRQVTIAKQRMLERQVIQQSRRYPAGLGCLVLIDPHVPAPVEAVRREIDRVLTSLAPRLRALAWIVLGDGFQAAGTRGVLTGLRLIRSRPYPTKVMSDLRHALQWMLPLLDGGERRLDELDEHVNAIQRSL